MKQKTVVRKNVDRHASKTTILASVHSARTTQAYNAQTSHHRYTPVLAREHALAQG
jgi:hypothetical protein